METKTILVSIVVASLGIAAAVAGFAAEATKVKSSQLKVVYYGLDPQPVCEYPSSPAMGLAIAATVALVIARLIITSTTGGCCSCCRRISNLPRFGRVCIVISWITSSIAVILFIAGAKLSSQQGLQRDINGVYYCYTVRPGVFSGAGVMGIVGVLLGLVYYYLYVMARSRAAEKPVDVELEKPQITTDAKKPPITEGLKPQVPLQKH